MLRAAVALVLLFGVSIALYMREKEMNASRQKEEAQKSQITKPADPPKPPVMTHDEILALYRRQKEDNVLKISVHKTDWHKGGFGNVMLATFVVRNNGGFYAKDITFECSMYSESRTYLGKASATVYQQLSANSSKKFRDVNLGFIHSQAASSSCVVSDFEYDLASMTDAAKRRHP